MSAEYFQTKCASVMESMLKSAVAETTKLFETMVDELKAEISRIKKENEDLKARYSRFERSQSPTPVCSRESDGPPRPNHCSERRDTAVQCDIVPSCTMLVKECLPLKNSSLQNQEQEHNFDTHPQMAFIFVKQESILKQDEVELINVCGKVDNSDLPWATACASENDRPGILPEKDKELHVALELPCLGMFRCLQRAQNQPSEPQQALVISFTAVNDDKDDETSRGPATSGEQPAPTAQQQPSVTEQTQRETESTSQCVEELLAEPKPQNKVRCEEVKNRIPEAHSQPVCHRRAQPPKKAKRQQEVKVILASPSAKQMLGNPASIIVEDASSSFITPNNASIDAENSKDGSVAAKVVCLSKESSTVEQKTSQSQQLPMKTPFTKDTQHSFATETLNSTRAESRQFIQLRARRTSVTLQDAMLLVEAMNQSPEENTISPTKRLPASPQSQCSHQPRTLQGVGEAATEPKTPPSPVPFFETAGRLSNKAQACIKILIPKQQHAVSHPFNATKQPMPSSVVATQTSIQSQQHHPHPLQTSAAASEHSNTVPHKIIVMPGSKPSLTPNEIVAPCSTKLSTFVPAVVAPQNNNLNVTSPAAWLPVGASSFSCEPQKRIYVASRKMLPVVLSQSTATLTAQKSGIPPHPNMTITIPKDVQAVASSTLKPQTIILLGEQPSAEAAANVKASSLKLMSPSKELTFSMAAQTASDEVVSVSSQKCHHTTVHKDTPKQTESDSHFATKGDTQASLNTGVVPASLSQWEQKLSPTVRLTKLPFSVLAKKSVLVSRVLPNGCSETQPLSKEGAIQEKLSSAHESTQPLEGPVVSTEICPSLKDASEENNIPERALLSSDTGTILGESWSNEYEQTSAQPKMVVPVLETFASEEPSVSNFVEETLSNDMKDNALANGFPTEDKEQSDTVPPTTSATCKDSSDPGSEMIKNQYLAQLAVLPVTEAPKKASSNDSADTRTSNAETCISGKKLQKDSPVTLLRSHIRTQMQTRGAKRNPDLYTEIQTTTINPKEPGLENDSPNDNNITTEPISIAPKKPGAVEDVMSLNKTTNDCVPYSPSRTRLCKAAFRQMSVSKSITSPKATGETSSSGRCAGGSKITPNHSVCSRRTSLCKDDDCAISTKDGTIPKNTKSTSVSPKRTGSTTEDDHLKKTEDSTASSSENGTSPKMSHHGIIHISPARSAFTLDSSSTKRTKRSYNSCNYMKKTSSSAIAETKSDAYFLSTRCTQQAQDGESSRNPNPEKTRLMQEGATPKKKARVLNARKLAKAAKIQTIAKMQKNANAGQLDSQANCEVLKKYKALGVWIPPRISATKTPSESRQRLLPVKKETRSPKLQNHVSVAPPSISLHPIPVKAPPVISPFEPLSVIGGRLLKNQCGECGRVLSSSAALESHVSLHTGRRPFSCMLCGKSFPDHKGLKRHGRVHRNGRIHICQECGKGFVYNFGLTKHIQMVHSRIKPFVCQTCNKGFFTKRDVEAHIRIHTGEKPFHCNLCDKKFTRRVELNVHLRWHNGEKRHWCPFCGKGFLDFNNLKRHKYIHTGEKPHSCPHCPKHFTQSGHLKKHVKNVHKIQ
ncbi:uncharacterized protein LOC115049440 [Echeneis naucrates]|uniref:uncharacterized protein LOC115049440 n=1 Tax=Echeneis naucrates TaxID=173247 RepID=UPI001114175E|nr:uncharacterized protein LOC115049440 [Echeneis naucrates]